jgi:hypothetical protein
MEEVTGVDEYINKLNIIASLTEGKTFSTKSLSIIDHGSWSTALWRYYAGEDRYNTMLYMETIIND